MVNTLPSGLKYTILKPAAAAAKAPTQGRMVTVHYDGWLEKDVDTAQKFDSSIDRQKPFQFVLGIGYVIKGWDEGVSLMKVGEKRRYTIPAELGYGAQGAGGGVIPPNATLVFDIELLDTE